MASTAPYFFDDDNKETCLDTQERTPPETPTATDFGDVSKDTWFDTKTHIIDVEKPETLTLAVTPLLTEMPTTPIATAASSPTPAPQLEHVIQWLPTRSVTRGNHNGSAGSVAAYDGKYRGIDVVINEVCVGEDEKVEEVEIAIRQELASLYRLRHCNFVSYPIGLHQTEDAISLVIEVAENGGLAKYLRRGNLKNDWYTKARICLDIADAVGEMHTNGIAHGNLKAENLNGLGSRSNYTSVIQDDDDELDHTPRYTAPENLLDDINPTFDQQILSDIYGLGMIMWEVSTDGKQPFSDCDDDTAIKHAISTGPPDFPRTIPAAFAKIIRGTLISNPSTRLALPTILHDLNAYLSKASGAASTSKPAADNAAHETGLTYYTAHDFASALPHFTLAASQDHVPSLRLLGLCEKALGTDPSRAFGWFTRSADAGDLEGQFHLAACHEDGYGTERNMEAALDWYQASAMAGNASSLERLYRAVAVERNEAVLKWFCSISDLERGIVAPTELETAARDHEDTIAACVLARWYEGAGEKEPAVGWLLTAAEGGNVLALDEVCELYRANGIVTEEQEARAWALFRKEATAGDKESVRVVCRMVAAEEGDPNNDDDAAGNETLRWVYSTIRRGENDSAFLNEIRRSANDAPHDGQRDAQYVLAKLYHSGALPSEDAETALRWYLRSASQGHLKGQCMTAHWYRDQDREDVLAYEWFAKAAAGGDSAAQFEAGECLRTGRGAARDEEEATRWFRTSAAGGYGRAVSKLCEAVFMEWAVDVEAAWIDSRTFEWIYEMTRKFRASNPLLEGLRRVAAAGDANAEIVLAKMGQLERETERGEDDDAEMF
ncbi:hypothetical protein BC936DRAFT_137059 [Jimgerdemannia flammicorona]|uniref:Protein kinase domain-containing protein n=1 Tax=Jimgerdemannia flammicorona TaxID=994334 RepID=A0A433CY48_9FUNG|nr:hypothetical protein BC936DRAFT_137059 [Jimgerdemannia flammicorona]